MAETGELPLGMKAPDVTVAEVDALCGSLVQAVRAGLDRDEEGRPQHGWLTAKQLHAITGWNDRKIRAVAEHSDGRILSGPGCPGYKLFDGSASLDDARRAANALQSQGNRMLHRSKSIWARYHRYAHS